MLLLNVDSAVAGTELDLDGVPSLRDLVLDAAGAVTDVRTGQDSPRHLARCSSVRLGRPVRRSSLADPLWDDGLPRAPVHGRSPDRARFSPSCTRSVRARTTRPFSTTWASRRSTSGSPGGYGVYHSIYDDFTWMEKFGDPEFLTHATAARLYTAIAMRAAGAEVLPLRFTPYGDALRDHVDELRLIQARHVRSEATRADAEKVEGGRARRGIYGALEPGCRGAGVPGQGDWRSTAPLDAVTAKDQVSPAALAKLNDAAGAR